MAYYRILRGIHGRHATPEEREQTGQMYVTARRGDIIEKDPKDPSVLEDVRTLRLEPVSEGGPLLASSSAESEPAPSTPAAKGKRK